MRCLGFLWVLMLLWGRIRRTLAVNNGQRKPFSPLPLHLQDEPRLEINLRAAVLHSDPFAIIEEDELTGELTARGLQIDLLSRISEFAAEDGVDLKLELDLWQYSPERTYNVAVDLVANDCEDKLQKLPSDSNITKLYDCNSFDFIVADLLSTSERFLRVDMTPPWLNNDISVMKFVGSDDNDDTLSKEKSDITTLSEAEHAQATVCVRKGTRSSEVVMDKFPGAHFLRCYTDDECYQHLRYGRCSLYSRDELVLINKGNEDPEYEVTKERFHTQYLVWPMRYDLPPTVSYLLKRWIKRSIEESTMDELYRYYFQKKSCPIGTAGENCELNCDPEHGYSDSKTGQCICESTKWTGSDCSIEVEEDLNLIPTPLRWISYGLFAINGAAIVCCAIWLYQCRETDQVRASQPFFLMLVLLGCLISSSTIIALAEECEGEGPVPACMVMPWLYSVGFSLTFGSLFAKIRRVHQVFKQAKLQPASNKTSSSPRGSVAISFQETLMIIGAVTLVDIIILSVWTAVDPLHWHRVVVTADKFGQPLESEGFCTSDHWPVFGSLIGFHHLVILSLGSYLCYKARKISTMFQEGKFVFIAMLSNLQLYLVGVPILVLGSDPQTSFFVRSCIVWMTNLSVIALIFGNLIFKTYFQQSSDDPISGMALKQRVNDAVSRYKENSTESLVVVVAPQPGIQVGNDDIEAPAGGRGLPGETRDLPEPRNNEPSAVSTDSECQCKQKSEPPQVNRIPRNMISSISMDSGNFDLDISQWDGLAPVPERSRALDSSSSMGSSLNAGRRNRTGGSRSVTFGMAYYSEGNDDGSELAIPLGGPETDEEESDRNAGRLRSRSLNSMARFRSDSLAGAPPKQPKRHSFSFANDDEMEGTTLCSGTESGLVDSDNLRENNGPPQRPTRRGSSSQSGQNESDSDASQVLFQGLPEANQPPQQPVRMESSVEYLSDYNTGLDSDATTAASSFTPQSPLSNNGPPQRPDRLISLIEVMDENSEIQHDSMETNQSVAKGHGAPQQPKRLESSVEHPSDYNARLNSDATTAASNFTPQSPLSNSGPPQRPDRLISLIEVMDENTEIQLDSEISDAVAKGHGAPQQPTRLASKSTLECESSSASTKTDSSIDNQARKPDACGQIQADQPRKLFGTAA